MNILEDLYISKRHNKALSIRKYYHNTRNSLIELLGSKCSLCGFNDIRALQIDHKISSCKKDKVKFGNNLGMCVYYLNHPIFAFRNLQILCANCNWIKRSVNNEDNKRKYEDKQLRQYIKSDIYRKFKTPRSRKILTYRER